MSHYIIQITAYDPMAGDKVGNSVEVDTDVPRSKLIEDMLKYMKMREKI